MIKLGVFKIWLDCNRHLIDYGYFNDRPDLVWAQFGDFFASGKTLCSVLEFVVQCMKEDVKLLQAAK